MGDYGIIKLEGNVEPSDVLVYDFKLYKEAEKLFPIMKISGDDAKVKEIPNAEAKVVQQGSVPIKTDENVNGVYLPEMNITEQDVKEILNKRPLNTRQVAGSEGGIEFEVKPNNIDIKILADATVQNNIKRARFTNFYVGPVNEFDHRVALHGFLMDPVKLSVKGNVRELPAGFKMVSYLKGQLGPFDPANKVQVTDAAEQPITPDVAAVEPVTPEPATPPASAEEPVTPPASAEEPATPPASAEEPATPPASAEEPATPPASAEEPVTPPASAEEPVTPPASAEEPATPAVAAEPEVPEPAAETDITKICEDLAMITSDEDRFRFMEKLEPSVVEQIATRCSSSLKTESEPDAIISPESIELSLDVDCNKLGTEIEFPVGSKQAFFQEKLIDTVVQFMQCRLPTLDLSKFESSYKPQIVSYAAEIIQRPDRTCTVYYPTKQDGNSWKFEGDKKANEDEIMFVVQEGTTKKIRVTKIKRGGAGAPTYSFVFRIAYAQSETPDPELLPSNRRLAIFPERIRKTRKGGRRKAFNRTRRY